MASRLEIRVLGPPRAFVDATPLEVDTRKAMAILVYLAVTGRPQGRDSLAAMLWPDYPTDRARAALRRTLSVLRSGLGGGFLVVAGGWVGLDSEGVELDLAEFRRLLSAHAHPGGRTCPSCPAELSRAVELYGGDFLAGFGLRDSPAFDDWQSFQAEAARRDLAGGLERLAEGHAGAGRLEAAVAAGRRRLELDPLNEQAHRRMMHLHASAGDRSAALRQYRECLRILDRELGVAPLEETTDLYHAIERGEVAPSGRPPAAPLPEAPAPYPMVGRTAEWEAIVRTYASAGESGRLVAIEGEAGIGKTRLAAELVSWARGLGASVVEVRCHEDEAGVPYAAVAEALASAGTRWSESLPPEVVAEAGRLAPRLLEEQAPPPERQDGPAARRRLLDAVAQAMGAAVRGPVPGVLFVDDLHWADEGSLDCLTYLARRLDANPLVLLVTWRMEDVASGHRLRRLVAEGRRAGWATSIAPGRLSEVDVSDLLEAVSGTEAGRDLRRRLHRETEGLPFFVVEYLTAVASGTIEAGRAWPTPGGVADLIRSRLGRLSDVAAQGAAAAAVLGRSFDAGLLQDVSGRTEEETVSAVEELERRGLIRAAPASDDAGPRAHDFTHEKLREVVYGDVSLARRRLLHRRVAEALSSPSRGRREPAAGLIAHHYRMAGLDPLAAEFFARAGEHARLLHANVEALQHVRTALALGHPDASRLHESAGDLLTLQGDYRAAVESYEAAAASSSGGALSRLEHKIGDVHHRRGAWDLAEAHLAAAADLLQGEGGARAARLHADWSMTAYRKGDGERAARLARQALELAGETRDPESLAKAHNILGILAGAAGEGGAAREHLERSLAFADLLADPSARVAALNNLALACRREGDLDRAVELTGAALALCTRQGDRHREAALHNNLADLLHAAGRAEEAMVHLKQAVAIFAEVGEEAIREPEIWKLVEW